MSMSASQILDAIAPDLGTPEQRATFLIMADERTSTTSFGSRRQTAVALRAAHEMTLLLDTAVNSGSGPLQSKREGDLSVSYFYPQVQTGVSGDFSLTKFGQRLLGLVKGNVLTMCVTGMEGTEDSSPRLM